MKPRTATLTMMNNAHAHSPTLRRAVIRARPDFYSLSEAEQLAYWMQMPDTDRFVLERSVFRELYGVDCDSIEALRAAWDDVPIGELDAINETLLPWHGIGEDCFYLNEFVPEADRLRWTTVDDYVREDHAFQESAREKDFTDYTATPYQGNLQGCWARLFIDGRFRYATLTSLAGHLSDHISELGYDLLNTLIPHRYVRGPNDGQREGDNYVWNMRRDAGGLEPQLDELSSRLYAYESRRWLELLDEFDRDASGAVYIQDVDNEVDEQTHFIFSDKTAMARVRFRQFVRDCRCAQRAASELMPLEQRESTLLNDFLREQHEDVMQTVNPKVAKLKKRRKILVHKDAFR